MKNFKNRLFYLYSGIIYVFLIVIFVIASISFLEEHATNLLVSTFAANKQQSENIVEVVIDDYSVQKYKWPWTKDRLADILDYFKSYSHPSVIGMDLDISYSPDMQQSDKRFVEILKKMKNVVILLT